MSAEKCCRIIYAFAGLGISILLSCNSEKDDLSPAPPDEPWVYLADTASVEALPASFIKVTAQRAGYPQFNKYIEHAVKLYKITYHTVYKGEPVLASGIISYPLFLNDSVPWMIVGNGLVFADEDAPTSFDLPDNYTGFEFIASLGYFTLVPDMLGYGASKDLLFPIHNYEHSARTMVDFIHAANEFKRSKGLKVSQQKFLTGYSQGGYIALATLKKLEENPGWGIIIDAAAVGAGGFNLPALLDHALDVNTYTAPSHLALLLSSYNIIYEWNRPLSDFFQEPFAAEIPNLLDGNYNREEIDAHLAYSFDSLLAPEFLLNLKNHSEINLLNALEENSVYNWAPKTPLRILHSLYDDRIPLSDSEDTYKTMVSKGSESVKFIPVDAQGHINSGIAFVEKVIPWFNSLRQ